MSARHALSTFRRWLPVRGYKSWTSPQSVSLRDIIPVPRDTADLDSFRRRHIGPDDKDARRMLAALRPPASSMQEFIMQVIPKDVLSEPDLMHLDGTPPLGLSESQLTREGTRLAGENHKWLSLNGQGYFGTLTPGVIKRNVLENPAWYTSYTPYQPELSQGRLECLLNFQTMVCDLTGLPVSNASLLDEGTAAAEAMTMSMNALPSTRASEFTKIFLVDHNVYASTISVMRSRAEGLGITIQVLDVFEAVANKTLPDHLIGVLVQYPDSNGSIRDCQAVADAVHERGALLSAATDLLALTLIKPPGEWGADIAVGSAQRFGVPIGYGGPHAGFMAVREQLKRRLPGRLVGISQDRMGNKALRLALQTREQHIRREKATSNVCTAQALLANMASLFAVYHGPEGLRNIATRIVHTTAGLIAVLRSWGYTVPTGPSFGILRIEFQYQNDFEEIMRNLTDNRIAVAHRVMKKGAPPEINLFFDETTSWESMGHIARCFDRKTRVEGHAFYESLRSNHELIDLIVSSNIPDSLRRTSDYLTHPVFNTHHSETELLRYIHHLQSKDLSLVHSMIPLGSCTMKLNATSEMQFLSFPGFSHPAPWQDPDQLGGYRILIQELKNQLAQITGMDAVSVQPNSGAQGEFAGLRAIRKYHEGKKRAERDVCLIPYSAHGTNPASATMAGMRVVPLKCDAETGNLDLADLEEKCQEHKHQLAAIMVTYPSTFGVFEPAIRKVCEIVHEYGGLVYMDGANMNAQIGLCSPGEIGADVCHLNLHKTFCIPHGGGGPGVGPVCVKQFLAKFLPGTTREDAKIGQHMVSSAPYGSASILTISWAYVKMMGGWGLRQATEMALLNANYLMSRLRPHYSILYTNAYGRCAHEFIIDARPFRSVGIEAIDVAKRLQDYGFHAPTMSWPVPGTLMIEPTESESREELDRFVDALVSIRQEIRDIEEGRAPRDGNLLKMAPHPMADIICGDDGAWNRPYTREQAAYPLPSLKEKKFWPSVARVDDTYGDRNLVCTCPPVEDTTGETKFRAMER